MKLPSGEEDREGGVLGSISERLGYGKGWPVGRVFGIRFYRKDV
jgi:hypothetical protein